MKRKNVWGLLLAAGLPLVFAACSDDDPPAKAKAAFPETSARVSESDGTPQSFHPNIGTGLALGTTTGRQVKFKVTFDKPLDDITVIAYSLDGTASIINPGTTQDAQVNDYSLAESGAGYTLDDEQITVQKGISEIELTINLYEDLNFEVAQNSYDEATDSYQETIIFTLTSVVSGPLDLDPAAQPAYTLTIYEDDIYVGLDWDISGAGADGNWDAGDADLDLYITSGDAIWARSYSETNPFEVTFLPAGLPDGIYGVRCPFFSGTTELDFYITFINLGGTVGGGSDRSTISTGHYALENVNEYSNPDSENYTGAPQVVQNITKAKLNYPTLSNIVIPELGSRTKESPVTPLHRHDSFRSQLRGKNMTMDMNVLQRFWKN